MIQVIFKIVTFNRSCYFVEERDRVLISSIQRKKEKIKHRKKTYLNRRKEESVK
jgi:hypothetical protein